MTIEELVVTLLGETDGWERVALVFVLASFGLLWRYLHQIRGSVRNSATAVRQMAPKVEDVKREFSKNSGSTTKDQLDRIEDVLGDLSERVTHLEAQKVIRDDNYES